MSDEALDLEPVNILLVDDRPSNLMALQGVLQQPDYELVLARSGEQALAQILRREVAVILLDVAMPGLDGFEVASIIKQRDRSSHIPIIFITASVYDLEHIFRGYTVGAVDYLLKPVDPHALRSKVGVFVELFRQRKRIERQAVRLREVEVREQQLLRAQAEEALRASESLYQLTFEQAPIGIGHVDADGRITRTNRQLGELAGRPPEELIGRRLADLVVGLETAVRFDRPPDLPRGEMFYTGEHEVRRDHGTVSWVSVTVTVLQAPRPASSVSYLVIAGDITARKQAELERSRLVRDLQHGLRVRDDFLSLAAHELKTPVTPLRLQVDSLLRDAERTGAIPRETLLHRLGSVERAIARIEGLVEHLLDIARLHVGALALERERLDLVALVGVVVRRLEPDAVRAGSAITVSTGGPVLGAWDRVRIEQVVACLLANAIAYGGGRPIEVTVSARGDAARVSVRDHGAGISADDQDRVFERFERLAPVRHHGGFGLGLWLVRKIVEAHGGHVELASEPGMGSVFTIELPLRPSPEPRVGRPAAGGREANP